MIRSLKHYFEKKNEFYTENLEPSYTNWNILKCKDLYLSKVSDIQREQSSQLLTEKTISTLTGMAPLASSKLSQLRVCCVHKIWKV